MKYSGKLLLIFNIFLILLISSAGCQSDSYQNNIRNETINQSDVGDESEVAQEKPVIRICIDLFSAVSDSDVRPLLNRITQQTSGIYWSYEQIPREEPERSNYLTRLRTEIMAGKGPDVFLCNCPSSSMLGLFPFPKQAANSSLFLSLDQYIENAQFMEWEDLFSIVMDAGKNAEGQQLLPLTYEFNMRLFDKENGAPDVNRPMTWEQMTISDDPAIATVARSGLLSDVFGELGDYDKNVPTFTEEDFLARTQEYLQFEFSEQGMTVYWVDGWLEGDENNQSGIQLSLDENGKNYFMLPSYNISGGITANICTFAAVNRNTPYPTDCFAALDYLLSKNAQQNENIYMRMKGWPTHMDVGSIDAPLHHKHMSESNFQEFSLIRNQIDSVKFYTPLDDAIKETLIQCHESQKTDESLQKNVHKQYTTIQMMLAES